ncbi:beta-glucuronosyltransferase GlcAT14A-like [Tasmannia lanceolata]|uniref:beta-glucuronosyltransferase GlcAT14A-like n=1 Tax=Tasmannia lanceolata TaxID=3420 RepID=UPI00406440A0
MQAASAQSPPKESKNLYCLLTTTFVSVLFILSFSRHSSPPSFYPIRPLFSHQIPQTPTLLLLKNPNQTLSPPPPSLAYLISGSDSDSDRIIRLLFSVYHPQNHYLLHLDLAASQDQRETLALKIQSIPVFHAAGNVNVIGKADFTNPRGASALASTLHGASILLRFAPNWDWFINLSVSNYPLVTQDDLLHVLSFLPRDLNFVQHTSQISWRESRRMKPIIVDPGLYLSSKNDIFYATQKREFPNAYKLFTGSPSVILSRKYVEFCILGLDNLPRTLLMYYTNTLSPHVNYFHTVLCNSREFNKTTINHNMHYVSWDEPPKREPRALGMIDFEKIIQSGAAFGTQFPRDDPVLDRIDREVLNRGPGKIVPGGWCLGASDDPCTVWGNADILRPGQGAKRLEKVILELLSNETSQSNHCIYQ